MKKLMFISLISLTSCNKECVECPVLEYNQEGRVVGIIKMIEVCEPFDCETYELSRREAKKINKDKK